MFITVFLAVIGLLIVAALLIPRWRRRRKGIGKNDLRHIRPRSPKDSNYNDFWGGRPM